MPCYNPLKAYQLTNGEIKFHETRNVQRELKLPCGQCIGCRLERSRQWAVRCMHEARMYEQNCFITLTYAPEHVPKRGSLDYSVFQKFMKRLRKHTGPERVRFYMCGEYGETEHRPHYHACLFGYDWPDKTFFRTTPTGEKLYRSETLEKLWPYGFATTGTLTFESAAYVARYCTKKITGHNAKDHYKRQDAEGEYELEPEFGHMSLKPGIGAAWLAKYGNTDVWPFDHVITRGMETKPPKYYDKILKRTNPDRFAEIQESREVTAAQWAADQTPDRLAAKEQVKRAQLRQLKRTL
ncbi:replication initiator protein [Apis mellifera associated microvirus 14]|nr:replication initiator protein [Apis mellifera associated microvirus 14]